MLGLRRLVEGVGDGSRGVGAQEVSCPELAGRRRSASPSWREVPKTFPGPDERAYGGRIVRRFREGGRASRMGRVGRGRVNVREVREGRRERAAFECAGEEEPERLGLEGGIGRLEEGSSSGWQSAEICSSVKKPSIKVCSLGACMTNTLNARRNSCASTSRKLESARWCSVGAQRTSISARWVEGGGRPRFARVRCVREDRKGAREGGEGSELGRKDELSSVRCVRAPCPTKCFGRKSSTPTSSSRSSASTPFKTRDTLCP
ncbi:hypothetical protein BJY59DRAFT_696287 [Rhodotorula toruloides]